MIKQSYPSGMSIEEYRELTQSGPAKNANRQLIGATSKRKGDDFEVLLNMGCLYYAAKGIAMIEKNPEPMRVIEVLGEGKYIAVYTSQAQGDYKGVLQGGQEIVFEAKATDRPRIEQRVVLEHQQEYLQRHSSMGAMCFVMVRFGQQNVYRVPWSTWRDMKEIFGRKYVTQVDLRPYKVPLRFCRTKEDAGLSVLFLEGCICNEQSGI